MLQRAHHDPALIVQARVLKALMLRDMRTRFFGHGLGYILAMLWPLSHIAFLLGLWAILGREAPLGENATQFFALGLIPVLSFTYMARYIAFSAKMNKQLLNFPIVKLLDIIFARAILEALSNCCIVLIMCAVLYALGIPIRPNDTLQVFYAFFATQVLGLAVGAINGMITFKLPMWAVVVILLKVAIYATSGILFLPAAIPEPLRYYLSFNPLMHSIEWIREGFYLGYQSTVLDKGYLLGLGFGLLFVALVNERFFRKALMR